jgi:hypothetical protein
VEEVQFDNMTVTLVGGDAQAVLGADSDSID